MKGQTCVTPSFEYSCPVPARAPTVDRLVHEIEKTLDPVKKEEMFKGIYREAWEDPPWLYMYRPRMFWGVSEKLKKWKPANDGLTFPFYFPK